MSSRSATGGSGAQSASSAKSHRSGGSGDDEMIVSRSQQSLRSSQAWANVENTAAQDSSFGSQAAIVAKDEEDSASCWGKFKRGARAVWMTKDTEDTTENSELKIKTTLRELVTYCLFLVIISILTFGMSSSTTYYYTLVMNNLFLDTPEKPQGTTFKGIGSIADWWEFTKAPMPNGLYWDTWYNSANITDPKERNFIFYENKLLGVPRIRQVRVRNDSCSVAAEFRASIRACYAMYSAASESRSPYGYMNSTAWNYTSEKDMGSTSYSGLLATYGGGGYYIDLARNRDDTAALITELFNGLWIDRSTRSVFIDFTVYNANINLFCVIKLVTEFSATGGAFPSWEFRTVKLLRYVEPMDYFVLACECIFMLFVCYYIVEETIEIRKHRLAYFKCFWNLLDLVVIGISLICASFNIYRTISVGNKLGSLLLDETKYPDFDFLSSWQEQFNNAIAITVFFAWVKIFKYISFNKTMTQLSSTLGACAKDLMGFAVMFSIVFFAFAQLGYLIFGTKVEDFREFQQAIFTLFRIILGDFDFAGLQSAHRILGPVYFILYVFFVFFVLINMFLAIINDTYSEVKSKLAEQPNEFEMGDYFKQRAGRVLAKLNLKRDKIVDIQKAMQSADMNNDRQLDFEEWRAELKMRGYADGEIEALFAKYDNDGDRVLDEDEQKRMQSELDVQKAALNDQIESEGVDDQEGGGAAASSQRGESGDSASLRGSIRRRQPGGGDNGVSVDEFASLSRRVDRMENNIGGIVTRIDTLLAKLDTMERAKVHRRETMSRLLDSVAECSGATEAEKRVRQEIERWGAAEESSGGGEPAAAAVGAGGEASRPQSGRTGGGGKKSTGSSR